LRKDLVLKGDIEGTDGVAVNAKADAVAAKADAVTAQAALLEK
jgi:hypothetical protein